MHSTTLNEQTLQLAQAGDKQAFSVLVSYLNNTVHAIALNITRDLQHSHDVSQLVFIKVWQQLGELKTSDSLLPWVRQITRYTAINFVRDNKHRTELASDDATMESLLDDVVNNHDLNEKSMMTQQQNQVINHLIEQLPDESREIVLLYYRQEHDSAVVANLLGLTTVTVRKRLQRVREQLKEQVLEKYGKVLFATTPIAIDISLALATSTASPVAAATLGSHASINQSHWLGKLTYLLGGAIIGAFFGVLANTFAINKTIKHIDNDEDLTTLKRLKRQGNIWIIGSAFALTASYQWTQGWLMSVITYALFLIGLTVVVNTTNTISRQNLQRQAPNDQRAKKLL
ncbi:MAG: RNA polymerase sigma factor, partial [Psychrobium sp.]